MPFSISVSMIVAAARNTTRSRSGNGTPVCVSSGTDSAVASVTEPRTAAHAMRNMRRVSGPVRGPAQPHWRRNRTCAEAHTQPIRSAISSATATSASIASQAAS